MVYMYMNLQVTITQLLLMTTVTITIIITIIKSITIIILLLSGKQIQQDPYLIVKEKKSAITAIIAIIPKIAITDRSDFK